MPKNIKSNQELEVPFHKKMSNAVAVFIENSDGITVASNDGKILRNPPEHLVKVEHDFAPGIYLRRMLMQENTIVLSAIHKRKHAWFLLEGEITLINGEEHVTHKAPHFHISDAGEQRIIYANKKSVFQNVFKNPNDTTDLDELEEYHYALTNEEFKEYINNKEIDD